MSGERVGEFLRSSREAQRLSQTELEKESGVKRDYIASIERGRISVIYPETLGRLRAVLGFPGWAALEAMGYQTDAEGSKIRPLLAAAVVKLTVGQQEALLDFLHSLAPVGGIRDA